jgi:hypothetical protein
VEGLELKEKVFFVVWGLLAIVGFLLFYVNPDAAFKKKYFRWFSALTGALFFLFILWTGFLPYHVFLIIVPVLVLIHLLNVRNTQFCGACGRTSYTSHWFTKAQFCSRCGAKLD